MHAAAYADRTSKISIQRTRASARGCFIILITINTVILAYLSVIMGVMSHTHEWAKNIQEDMSTVYVIH